MINEASQRYLDRAKEYVNQVKGTRNRESKYKFHCDRSCMKGEGYAYVHFNEGSCGLPYGDTEH